MRNLAVLALAVTVTLWASAAQALRYVPPSVPNALFVETFQGETLRPSVHWVSSRNDKYNGASWRSRQVKALKQRRAVEG